MKSVPNESGRQFAARIRALEASLGRDATPDEIRALLDDREVAAAMLTLARLLWAGAQEALKEGRIDERGYPIEQPSAAGDRAEGAVSAESAEPAPKPKRTPRPKRSRLAKWEAQWQAEQAERDAEGER